jgi:hypothetical protein
MIFALRPVRSENDSGLALSTNDLTCIDELARDVRRFEQRIGQQ